MRGPLLVDSHLHLDSPRYDLDREAVLDRAWAAGVRTLLAIGIGEEPAAMRRALELSREYVGRPGVPRIVASAGIYPHDTAGAGEETYAALDELLRQPEVVAAGEIGLDYYHEGAPHDVQRAAFSRQMELAAARKRPILIHCRPAEGTTAAWDDTLGMIEAQWKSTGLGGILHCFGGEWEQARRALDCGFLVSFAGNITFPRAQAIRDVAARVPRDRLLVETDAPYLAPVPHRGKRNEPAWVKHVAARIAEVRGIGEDEVAAATTENFCRLFHLASNVGH